MRRLSVTTAPAAILLVRLIVGSVFLSEGIQKFIFPEALGAGRFAKIGIPHPQLFAPFDGIFEIVCRALLLLGLCTRLAAIPLIIDTLVAIAQPKSRSCFTKDFGTWRTRRESIGRCCSGRSSCWSLGPDDSLSMHGSRARRRRMTRGDLVRIA